VAEAVAEELAARTTTVPMTASEDDGDDSAVTVEIPPSDDAGRGSTSQTWTPAVSPLPPGPRSEIVVPDNTRYAHEATARPETPAAPRPDQTATPARTRPGESGPEPFVPFQSSTIGDRSDIDTIRTSQRIQAAVRRRLGEIVAEEGPIEERRLARLTLQGFGFAKTHEDRRAAVLELLDPRWTRTDSGGTFIWPERYEPRTWTGFRQSQSSTDRDFDEIAVEEIANALCRAAQIGRSEADLLRVAMDLLGYRRKTEKVEARLRLGLGLALNSGRMRLGAFGHFEVV
jgi:hypothetical protein